MDEIESRTSVTVQLKRIADALEKIGDILGFLKEDPKEAAESQGTDYSNASGAV